jgi:hypothetical protein
LRGMVLATLLEQNRAAILGRWFDLITRTYPQLTSEFLAKQKDQFRNPVGHAINQSIGPIYDQVVSAMDTDELLRGLDAIIRIRCVQDFTPSEAVAFIFQLKSAIREVVEAELRGAEKWEDLSDLDARIDRVALLAFEKYTECRERLHEIRNNEIKNKTIRLLERANAKSSISGRKGELIDDEV